MTPEEIQEAAENLLFRLNNFEPRSTKGRWEGLTELGGGYFPGTANRNGLVDRDGDFLNRSDVDLIVTLQNHIPVIRELLRRVLEDTARR